MNTNDMKKTMELTPGDLALLGEGALGYIREIEVQEAKRLLGDQASVAPELQALLPLQRGRNPRLDLGLARGGLGQRLRA